MSELIASIQRETLSARKAGDKIKASLLVTLGAEIAKVGKDAGNRPTTEDEAVKVIKKFLTNLEDSLAVIKDEARAATLAAEKDILLAFMPAQVSPEALKVAITALVAELPEKSPKAMGIVMGKLKAQFGANYDGALASQLVKEALK